MIISSGEDQQLWKSVQEFTNDWVSTWIRLTISPIAVVLRDVVDNLRLYKNLKF